MPTCSCPMEKQPPQLAQPLHFEHDCGYGRATSPQLVQPLLYLIRPFTVGVPHYGKLYAANKAC